MLSPLRSWLRISFAVVFAAMLLGGAFPAKAQTGSNPHQNPAQLSLSPVILTERPDAVNQFTVDPQQVKQMLNRALLTLTSAPDIGTAWTRLGITPQDVVGIKITTAGGTALSTHRPLVQAICDGLQAAGLPRSQIIIWDKFPDKMTAAGYAPRAAANGQAAIASVVPDNYDPDVFYRNGMIGNLIWGDYQFNASLNGDFDSDRMLARSYYTKLVTQTCTKLINVPVLNYNEYIGIDGCLGSLALGCVDNNRRLQGPPTYGDPAIDEILFRDFIKRKVVVHILDALVAQCAGGPGFNPQFCQSFGALYVGRDPVAIDSLALPRLEAMRHQMRLASVGNTSSYVHSAAVLSLGTTDRRRIQFIRVP